jgi:hypothetical protein
MGAPTNLEKCTKTPLTKKEQPLQPLCGVQSATPKKLQVLRSVKQEGCTQWTCWGMHNGHVSKKYTALLTLMLPRAMEKIANGK